MRRIELLSPAKNKECAIEAITHGADAVYIGAPEFSARSAAGNTIRDIEEVCRYAHLYYAKVYAAFNTVLYDSEMEKAEKMIHSLYQAGVDALIIQDMGILELNLPPIALHASTQMDNRSVEKVKFLQETGFSQVVLARELTVDQIHAIAQETDVALEAFVHGSMCVSYSGQCYISQALCGRSANRGSCAQYCRQGYDLKDSSGKILQSNKHLFSLKDMNRSAYIAELIEAGISSFKIEGRLKEVDYVKNITAYYRQALDAVLEGRGDLFPASSGKSVHLFTPSPEKSFNRQFTSYWLDKDKKNIASVDTPKSWGQKIGTVVPFSQKALKIYTSTPLHNGDGCCFLNEKGVFEGFRVNQTEAYSQEKGVQIIYPASIPTIEKKVVLYRNYDHAFVRSLSGKSAERRIDIALSLSLEGDNLVLQAKDRDENEIRVSVESPLEEARNNQTRQQKELLSKWGDTIFSVQEVFINFDRPYFIPLSLLSTLKREAADTLLTERIKNRPLSAPFVKGKSKSILPQHLSYLFNITNGKAVEFYQKNGAQQIDKGFELAPVEDADLMTTPHCIQLQMGYCPRQNKAKPDWQEPLILQNGSVELQLFFDCKRCCMVVRKQ